MADKGTKLFVANLASAVHCFFAICYWILGEIGGLGRIIWKIWNHLGDQYSGKNR
jgi:hypothetical protein